MKWGLIPHWARDTGGPKPINAKSETVLDRAMFREPFRKRRCLIPATGFYEWQRVGKAKRPYHFRRRDGQPLALAGLWDRWDGPDGALLTCTILTTDANDLLRPVHDRMPVIIDPADVDLWLDPATDPAELLPLLRPYPADAMEAVAVSPLVNSTKNDGPECLTPVTYERIRP
jgi:putative SOS response-associated peptidase YedK